MPTPIQSVRQAIDQGLRRALRAAVDSGQLPAFDADSLSVELSAPREPGHGDWSTNLAMQLARPLRQPPRAIAEVLAAHFDRGAAGVERIEVAGPGFVNFFLDPAWLYRALAQVLDQGRDYVRTDAGRGQKVQVEFVSANPTGPMLVVNARQAAIGDALCNCLASAGFDVTREYYLDNLGTQVATLGRSVELRLRELLGQDIGPFPEDAYPAAYVIDVARAALDRFGPGVLDLPETERRAKLADFGVDFLFAEQRRQLDRFGVRFDVWFSQRSLLESGAVERALTALRERGHIFEADGAIWFRATAFGDEKDRVVIRSSGEPTYLMLDIAYHMDKFERGFYKVIDIWGADHHGYAPRLLGASRAFGAPEGWLEILIHQFVQVYKDGQLVRMSKRAGTFLTMEELLDEVGSDAPRFFFLMRANETHVDFDIDLAKRATNENPVFYVQYAHARIAGILRLAAEQGLVLPRDSCADALAILDSPEERTLIARIVELPEVILGAALQRQPHRLTHYATELATAFHAFYTERRVLGAENTALVGARLALVSAARLALATVLEHLGVTAPERM